jgi:hypothetical protein
MYRALGNTGFVTITTPGRHSLFHALAFATDRNYRSGRIALEKEEIPDLTAPWESKDSAAESTLVIAPINSEKYVIAMRNQLVKHLALPVEITSSTLRYQALDDTLDDAKNKLGKDEKFSPKYLDYIARENKIQLEVVNDTMKPIHTTPKLADTMRVILLDTDKQYILVAKLNSSNEMILLFSGH